MNCINSFLQKSFQSLKSSIRIKLGEVSYFLVKAAKSNSYIETLGRHADSVHEWIISCYEEDFRMGFELQVSRAVRHLNVGCAKLAFDITTEPFWGKSRSLYIFDSYEGKYDGEFHFITVCLITRNKQIPLLALPVHLGSITAKLAIELIEYCLGTFSKIRMVLFDRAFYCGELVDYLEAKRVRYIILVPEKKGVIAGYVNQTFELGKFRHVIRYSKDKSVWKPRTMIVVCKGLEDFPWIFATNVNFKTRCEYIFAYKRRWQIETNFRVEDEGRIKSKSVNHLIRYFYFLVSLLLHMLWIVNKNIRYYTPYKKYLDIIETELLYILLGVERV
jgi:hypothetical protein